MSEIQRILDCPMPENEAGAKTIKGFLKCLLLQMWHEGVYFSGKRPFGNSGWQNDIHLALVAAGIVEGKVDEDGYLDSMSKKAEAKADELIKAAIESL